MKYCVCVCVVLTAVHVIIEHRHKDWWKSQPVLLMSLICSALHLKRTVNTAESCQYQNFWLYYHQKEVPTQSHLLQCRFRSASLNDRKEPEASLSASLNTKPFTALHQILSLDSKRVTCHRAVPENAECCSSWGWGVLRGCWEDGGSQVCLQRSRVPPWPYSPQRNRQAPPCPSHLWKCILENDGCAICWVCTEDSRHIHVQTCPIITFLSTGSRLPLIYISFCN